MQILVDHEMELVQGAMGSRGQTVAMTAAQQQCHSGAGWRAFGGAIAGAAGGLIGVALGAAGGFIAGAGSSGCFAVPKH